MDEAVAFAERVVRIDNNDRVARLVLGVRAIKQKHYRTARRDLAQSVRGPITDLAATLLTAWSDYGAGSTQGRDGDDRQAGRAGLVRDVQGPACRPDSRPRRQREGGRQALRARLQARFPALRVVEAYGSWLSRNGSPKDALRCFETSTRCCPPSAGRSRRWRSSRRGEKLPPLVLAAGRRRRSALRPRRLARPPRRRGSRPRLSAARALSQARSSAGAAVARRSLRVAEEAGAGDQDLRARAGEIAAAPQCRNPDGVQSRHARSHREAEKRLEADQGPTRRISKRSWRSAIFCARARSSPNAPISTPRASPPSRIPKSRTG